MECRKVEKMVHKEAETELGGDMVLLRSSLDAWHSQSPLGPPLPTSIDEKGLCLGPEREGLLWEDFSVDDLLDLGEGGKEQNVADGEGFLHVGKVEGEGEGEEREESDGSCNPNISCSSITSSTLSFQTIALPPSSDPFVPAADVEDLEWVSRFVDDSYSEFASSSHSISFANLQPLATSAPSVVVDKEVPKTRITGSGGLLKRSWSYCSFSTASVTVPARTRSKRAHTSGRVWSLYRTPLLSDRSSASCSSASSSSLCSVFSSVTSTLGDRDRNPDLLDHRLDGTLPLYQRQLPLLQEVKKKKGQNTKVVQATAAAAGAGSRGHAERVAQRRCRHCGIDKTPQWRMGPMGAKTLCNACGVRYKSGRLLPEYRPAGSPSFLSNVHSNCHRKVLEIRRSKELIALASPSFCSPSPKQHPAGPTRPYGVV